LFHFQNLKKGKVSTMVVIVIVPFFPSNVKWSDRQEGRKEGQKSSGRISPELSSMISPILFQKGYILLHASI